MDSRHPKTIEPFFVNSIAKSGTHLLKQLIEGIPSIKHYDSIYQGTYPLQYQKYKTILSNIPPNHFVNGHLYYSRQYMGLFNSLNLKQIFLYRDPRDIVVSYAYFFMKLKNNPTRRFFVENNYDVKGRCVALINGFECGYVSRMNINDWYRQFLGWKYANNVLPISYESLVESSKSQKKVLMNMIRFLNIENVPGYMKLTAKEMQNSVQPQKSPTYRKGKSGDWKVEFDDATKDQFKKVAGDLLIELGYEKDYNW
ncbi:sulfotransferase domain-containing protein [Alkalihalobacillus sp. AL-G]|uniref:sulfotransferase domain-containing protein n=1 Tax=Alkalihalobacillus sp. AL-G TaxID=2926399 RepID=UPI00272AC575|nr:sulfotransferase domain-containing protein [Alkalihalobacillus sp. AL-G]WLD93484.1 sulfotransferase domain-containing protein [Alkalihalobacillus sp. AL-G]